MIKNSIFEELRYFNFVYYRAKDDSGDVVRGEVFIENRRIPHYPRIGRILTLREGIKRNFSGRYWVEEKYDGYNVRVFKIGNSILAATRGGIICPFSTERLIPYLNNLNRFFERYPDYVLVGEIVGEQNPYMDAPTTYELSRKTDVFFFDIMDQNASLLLPSERRKLLEEFSLPQVPHYGVFTPDDEGIMKVVAVVKRLNAKRREGIVIKSDTVSGKYIKYVTPVINLMDIAGDSYLMPELPGNFFTSRLIRYVLSAHELGVDESGFDLDSLFYKGLKKAIEKFSKEGYVYKDVNITFSKMSNLEEFLNIFRRVSSRHIAIKKIQIIESEEGYVLKFRKVYLDSTKKLRDYFSGKYLYD